METMDVVDLSEDMDIEVTSQALPASAKATGKKAIFVVSEKGGVGKTTFARGWLEVARSRGRVVSAHDADGSVGQLRRFYGSRPAGALSPEEVQDPKVGVGYFDIHHIDIKQGRDRLIEAMNTDAPLLLIDLPGGSLHEVERVFGDFGLFVETYKSDGWEIVIVIVIDHLMTPARSVFDSIRSFGDGVKYVVVKNLAIADASEFLVFDGYKDEKGVDKYGKASKLLAQKGGQVICMPRLEPRTFALIDVDSLTFGAAASNNPPRMDTSDRVRTKAWLTRFEQALAGTMIDP